MFGFFKKKYKFDCPFCGAMCDIRLEKDDYTNFDYMGGYYAVAERQICEFGGERGNRTIYISHCFIINI